jgi:hypothetical protein
VRNILLFAAMTQHGECVPDLCDIILQYANWPGVPNTWQGQVSSGRVGTLHIKFWGPLPLYHTR